MPQLPDGVHNQIEHLCEVMHHAYEQAAEQAGWATQERSRVPWADVPEANKVTMRAAVLALLVELSAFGLLAQPMPREENFERALAHVLNSHSAENGSNTPDFILASYLKGCLELFNATIGRRSDWYGRHDAPGQ